MHQGNSTRRSEMAGSSYNLNKNINRGLSCKFHPTNELHTFCLSPKCMLPMCSMCISIHNEDHYVQKSYGNYKDLQQVIRDTLQTIQQQQLILQELSNQYVGDYLQKTMGPEKCKQLLAKVRIKAHEELDRVFDRYMIDMEQKIDNYSQKLHQIYNSLQNRIHAIHKLLDQQKNDLNLNFSDNYNSRKSLTKRSNGASFVASMNTSNQLSRHSDINEKKQERKILKTLIQFQSTNQKSVNNQKIIRLKQQIKQIKQINLQIEFDATQIVKSLNNICYSCLKCKNSFQLKQMSQNKKKQVRFAKSDIIDSQTSIIPPSQGKLQTRPTNERLKKINHYPITQISGIRSPKMQNFPH